MSSFDPSNQINLTEANRPMADRFVKPLTYGQNISDTKTDIIKICVLDDCPLRSSGPIHGKNAQFVVGMSQMFILVWDLSTHQVVARSHRITWKVKAMCAYSSCNSANAKHSDSSVVYTGEGNTINIWRWRNDVCETGMQRRASFTTRTGDIPNVIKLKSFHTHFITALHVMDVAPHMRIMNEDVKQGRCKNFPVLISTSDDCTTRLWNLNKLEPLMVFRPKIHGVLTRNNNKYITTKGSVPVIHFIFPHKPITATPIEVAPVTIVDQVREGIRGIVDEVSVTMSSIVDTLSGDSHEDDYVEKDTSLEFKPKQFGKHPYLFLGSESGDIMCYRFELRGDVEEAVLPVDAPAPSKPKVLTTKNVVVRYHSPKYLTGHTDRTNAFATFTQRNHALESLDDSETYLLSCSEDKTIKMWDISRDGVLMRTFANGHSGVIYTIGVCYTWENPNEDVIISGGIDNKIQIWNVRNGDILSTVDTSGQVCTLATFTENVTKEAGVNDLPGSWQVERQSYLLYNSDFDICMRDIRIADGSLRYRANSDVYYKDPTFEWVADSCLALAPGIHQQFVSLCTVPRLGSVFICSYVQAIEYDPVEADSDAGGFGGISVNGPNGAAHVQRDDVIISIACTTDPLVPLKVMSTPTLIKNDIAVGLRAPAGSNHGDLTNPLLMKVYKLKPLQLVREMEYAANHGHSGGKEMGNVLVCADQHTVWIYEIVDTNGQFSLEKLCTYELRGACTGESAGGLDGTGYPASELVDFGVCFESLNCPLLIIALKHKLLAFKLDSVECFKDFKSSEALCDHCLKFRDQDGQKSIEMKSAVESLGEITSMICFADPRTGASEMVQQSPEECRMLQLSTAEVTICCGFGDGSICVIECEAYQNVLHLERRSNTNDIRIMKGHQDGVTSLSHFVYRRATGGNHCALVSGGVDSTMHIWDISVEFKSLATGHIMGLEKPVSAIAVYNNKGTDDTGIDVTIMCANEDGVIYVWSYSGGSVAVLNRRYLGGHNGSSSTISCLGFSSMHAFDDTNRTYHDDFLRLCAESEGHHIRREGMINRGIFLLSCDRDRLNIWETGDGVNSSTCCNATKRLPNYAELQIAFEHDLRGHELVDPQTVVGDLDKSVSVDSMARHAARKRSIGSENMVSAMSSFGGEHNKECPFNAFKLLLQDSDVASKVLGWHGVNFFVEAVNPANPKHNVHWNFVDMFLEKCPSALLRDELRFIDSYMYEHRTAKSILALAVEAEPKKLKSVRVIVNCWITLLNTKPEQAYDLVYLRSLFMPKEDVLMLARECPQEFEHFVSELKVMHAHPMVYGDHELFSFVDHRAKVHGSHHMWAISGRWSNEMDDALRYTQHQTAMALQLEAELQEMKQEFDAAKWQSWVDWWNVYVVPGFYRLRHRVLVLCLLEEKDSMVTESSMRTMSTAYYIPLTHCSDHGMLTAYVDVCNKLNRNNIFKAPIVVVALRYAWKKYGRRFHLLLLYRFLWFLIIFGLACIGFGLNGNGLPLSDPNRHNRQFMTLGIMPQVFLFFVNLSYIKDEAKLISLTQQASLFGGLGLLSHFTANIWNAINCLLYLAIFVGAGARILFLRELDLTRICMASASVLMAAKLLYFFRAFESTGRLISYLVKILKGISYFLVVLALVVLGFAFAFWITANGVAPSSPFSTLDGTLVITFAYMMGQFDATDFQDINVNQFARFMYVLFMVVSSIILLNLLIAIMGDIYSSVEKNALAQFRWEQCNVIIANMFNIEKKVQAKSFNEPLTVHVLKVKNPLDDENTTPSNDEMGAQVEPDFAASSSDIKSPEQERAELLVAITNIIKDQQSEFKHQMTLEIAEMLRRNAQLSSNPSVNHTVTRFSSANTRSNSIKNFNM